MREVGKRVRKKDAMALVTGQPVYTDCQSSEKSAR